MKIRSRSLLAASLVAVGLLSYACGGSPSSPSGTANLQGTVISDSSGSVAAASGTGTIVVSVAGTGLSTATDSAGRFSLSGIPAGSATLNFKATGINAQLMLSGLSAGQTMSITVHVEGTTATLEPDPSPSPSPEPSPSPSPEPSPSPSPTTEPPSAQKCFAAGAHAEVEGHIQAVDATSITVFQNGTTKGAYLCLVSDATRIRKGNTTYTLTDLVVGLHVHVSGTGLESTDGSCQVEASQIKIQ